MREYCTKGMVWSKWGAGKKRFLGGTWPKKC